MEKSFEIKLLHPRIKSGEWDIGYKTAGAAAVDLVAAIDQGIAIWPGKVEVIRHGVAVFIKDPGIAGLTLPRSGLGGKQGVILGNSIGLYDSDYQGEMSSFIWNRSDQTVWVNPGDRIAQFMLVPVIRGAFHVVEEFSTQTERGSKGWGSTGVGH